MKREVLRAAVVALVALGGVVIAAGCDDGKTPSGCKADADCPTGTTCRDEVCISFGGDASVPAVPYDAAASTCTADGQSCTLDDQCCSRTCNERLCGAPGPTQPGPTCRGLYELCQNDCCPSLSCIAGSCR